MAGSAAGVGASGIEENAMALLDSSSFRSAADLHDDRAAFLEAVRSACLSAESSSSPSWRMSDAVFQILQDSSSLELAVASFQLVLELDQRYPRVKLINSKGNCDLVVVTEAWSPFLLASSGHSDPVVASRRLDNLFDLSRFCRLIENMTLSVSDEACELGIKAVQNLLLIQYLVCVLEEDFNLRRISYKESLNWILLRESLLNMLLGSRSRKSVYKTLMKDIMVLLHKVSSLRGDGRHQKMDKQEEFCADTHCIEFPLALAISEFKRGASIALKKLFVLILELDVIRKEADLHGLITKADGFRDSAIEVILDELTYSTDNLSPFFMTFDEPKWKMEIILQYFSKYCIKSSVRTRRAGDLCNNLTLVGILTYFSKIENVKFSLRRMPVEVAQLLLAHAYQVSFSLLEDSFKTSVADNLLGGDLLHISDGFIVAFRNIRKGNMDTDISPFERGALFSAATVTSRLGT